MTTNQSTIPITNRFAWKRFSLFEVIQYKLQTMMFWLLCLVFDSHSWELKFPENKKTTVLTKRHYVLLAANNLVCEFCKKESLDPENDLTDLELSTYNLEVSYLYERQKLVRDNAVSKKQKTQGSQNT